MAPIPVQKVDISQTPAQPPQNQESVSGSAGSVPSPQDRAPLGANYYLTEGLEGVKAQHYRGTQSFITAINLQADQLRSGDAGQYAVFSQVTQDELANIECFRNIHYKSLRFLYYEYEQTLIVKIMLSAVHELACTAFEAALIVKLAEMGLYTQLGNVRSATFQGILSRKEVDSAFKPPLSRPNKTDWPTLVIECGVSESIACLRIDSAWWLENSGGQVKTVLLFSVSESKRKIHIEQWEICSVPNLQDTRDHPNTTRTGPGSIHTIDIIATDAAGASLELNFEKLFHHKPGKGEKDIIFTTQDLEIYADHVWGCAQ